jgi:hypothetical protein
MQTDDGLTGPAQAAPASSCPSPPEGAFKVSLVALPFWYQLVALILSALIPFFLNDATLVSWASHSLHFDFGTSTLWTSSQGSSRYFDLVNSMSIRERLGFAAYASFVFGVVVLTTKILFPSAVRASIRQQEGTLKSSKKQQRGMDLADASQIVCDGRGSVSSRAIHRFLVFPCYPTLEKIFIALHVAEALLLMKHLITECVESSHFELATMGGGQPVVRTAGSNDMFFEFALALLQGIAVEPNVHVVVQLDIVFRLLSWWFARVYVPAMIVFLYRLVRDARARRVHSLRWYFLSFVIVRSAHLVAQMLVTPEKQLMYSTAVENFLWEPDWFRGVWKSPLVWSELVQLLRGLWLAAAVNYIYGPSHRSSFQTIASSKRDFISSVFKMMMRCACIPLLASLAVLGFAVGVHIVELLLLWVFTLLALLWIPVALDSGSVELICFLACVGAFVNDFAPVIRSSPTSTGPQEGEARKKFLVDASAAAVALMQFCVLLAVSMLHNVGCTLFGSRAVSILVFVCTIVTIAASSMYLTPYLAVSASVIQTFTVSWLPEIAMETWAASAINGERWGWVPAFSFVWTVTGGCTGLILGCAFVNSKCERRWMQRRQELQERQPTTTDGDWSGDASITRPRLKFVTVCTGVLLAKRLLWLLALLVNIAVCIVGGVMSYYACNAVLNLPLDSEMWLAALCGVACFGALSDLTTLEYQFLLRIVGLCDPPGMADGGMADGLNDDSSEVAESQ